MTAKTVCTMRSGNVILLTAMALMLQVGFLEVYAFLTEVVVLGLEVANGKGVVKSRHVRVLNRLEEEETARPKSTLVSNLNASSRRVFV